jgi:hypothetical protein
MSDALALSGYGSKTVAKVSRHYLLMSGVTYENRRSRCRSEDGVRAMQAAFKWHDVAATSLREHLGDRNLQRSALTQVARLSAHCAGIGTDKLVLESFLKPAMHRTGVLDMNLRHVYSVVLPLPFHVTLLIMSS